MPQVIPVLIAYVETFKIVIVTLTLLSFAILLGNFWRLSVASQAPNSGLLGSDPKEAILIDQWIYFADAEIASPMSYAIYLLKGYIQPYNKPVCPFSLISKVIYTLIISIRLSRIFVIVPSGV